MNKEFLLFSLKYLDFLHEQTQTKPQQSLELKLDKPMETFSFEIPVKLNDRKWMLRLTSLELHISIFEMTEGKEKSMIATKGYWEDPETMK